MLAVVITHLPFSWSTGAAQAGQPALPTQITDVTEYGRLGVHLFLVLSGFCIHLRWARQTDPGQGLDFLPFWRRRLLRLYPPYAVTVVLSVLAMYVYFGVLGHGQGIKALGYDSARTLAIDSASLVFMFQNFTGAGLRLGNGPLWSLALEEQLYLLYFLLLFLRRRFGWGVALGIALSTSVLFRGWVLFFVDHNGGGWLRLGPARWFEWSLGALAVEVHLSRQQIHPVFRSWAFAIGMFALGVGSTLLDVGDARFELLSSDLLFGVSFFSAVLAVAARERVVGPPTSKVARALVGLGVFSYSVYLIHCLAIVPAKIIAVKLGLGVEPILLVRLVAAIAVSWVFYRLVERPFIRLAHR